MRKILFRGKNIYTGEWVYGMPCATEKSGIYAVQTLKGGIFDVIPETVGQYIGLSDKNGKQIFEGDVLQYTSQSTGDTSIEGVAVAEQWNCSCCYGVFGFAIDGGDLRDCNRLEITGNIHDNPKLVEEAR